MSTNKRVFISYGHDEYTDFVKKISEDLRANGIITWIDTRGIEPTKTWYKEIEKAIDQSELVMAFLTEHSVREDGFCINEILYALNKKKKILPIKIENVETPIFMLRIQWLDIKSIYEKYKKQSNEQYDLLIKQIIDDFSGQKPLQLINDLEPLASLLKPLDNETPISMYSTKLIGRDWLFKEFELWQNNSTYKTLIVYGFPGSGKSAFSTELVKIYDNISAIHFCISGNEERVLPHHMMMSLAFHLASQIPSYKAQLEACLIENNNIHDMSDTKLFEHLFLIPFYKMKKPNNDIFIVIDALDEAYYNGKNLILNLITSEFYKTPEWVRFVITSRPEVDIKRNLTGHTEIYLDDNNEKHVNDLKNYISHLLKEHKYKFIDNNTIERIIHKSNNNYIYIREIINMMISEESLVVSLPKDISDIYRMYFDRITLNHPDVSFQQQLRPILEVLYASFDPLNIDAYEDILGIDLYEIEHTINIFGMFFSINQNVISISHKTISDWLISRDMSNLYYINKKYGHKKIYQYLRLNFQNPLLKTYICKHYIQHALYSNDYLEVMNRLNDYEFHKLRERVLGKIHALKVLFDDVISCKNLGYDIIDEILLKEAFNKVLIQNREIFLDSQLIYLLNDFDFGGFVDKKLDTEEIDIRIINLRYLRFCGDYRKTYEYAVQTVGLFENHEDPIALSKLYQFAALSTYYFADYDKTEFYLSKALDKIQNIDNERLDYLTLKSFYSDNLFNLVKMNDAILSLEHNIEDLIGYSLNHNDYESQKVTTIQLMDARRCLILFYSLDNQLEYAKKHLDQVLLLNKDFIVHYEDYNKFKIVEMLFYDLNHQHEKADSLRLSLLDTIKSDYHMGLFYLYSSIGLMIQKSSTLEMLNYIDKGISFSLKRYNLNVLEQLEVLKHVINDDTLGHETEYLKTDNLIYYQWLYDIFKSFYNK